MAEVGSFGDGGRSAAVSSYFNIVHNYVSHHTKGEPWNSLMKDVTPKF